MTITSRLILTTLADLPTRPLHWLWQHYIPLGQLTLLEGFPGIGLSLLAAHLASCVSRGLPLPDGTPCQQGSVILIAALDSSTSTLASRVQAAGGDANSILPLSIIESHDTAQHTGVTFDYRRFSLLHDLAHLEAAITKTAARLVILDPISVLLAHPSISQRVSILTNLTELAQRTGCAILLLRPISYPSKAQLANPGHLSTSAARDLLLTAVRSRLLLLPAPTDPRQSTLLLHCTKHNLGPRPPTLAVCLESTAQQVPTLLWLGPDDDPDEQPEAAALSHQRQELLLTLQESESALDAHTLSRFCLQPYHKVRKTLQRMLHDGQLVSPARGLYTTPGHLCLLHFPALTSSLPNTSTEELPIHDDPPTGVAARFIAPAGKDGSTPLNPPATSVSNIQTISIQPSTPHPPSTASHLPTVATNQANTSSSTPSFESPVSTVASTPNQPANPNIPLPIPEVPNQQSELPFEDRSPSFRIPPRKEPDIYPGW
jgi:hypothetical protein